MDLAKRKSLVGPIKSDSGAMRKGKKATGVGLENRRRVKRQGLYKVFQKCCKGKQENEGCKIRHIFL